MAALLKWIQTPEADSIAKVAEKKAWKTFLAKYPKADKSKGAFHLSELAGRSGCF